MTGVTTNERMFFCIAREVTGVRAVTINMTPPQVICAERSLAASIFVIFNIIYVINTKQYELQIIIAAKNNITVISLFEKKIITVTRNGIG